MPGEPPEARRHTPDLDRLEAALRASAPLFGGDVARTRKELGDAWASAFDEAIHRLLPTENAVVTAADGYRRFAIEILRLQVKFDRTGAYEHRTGSEIAREIYADPGYMRSVYLPGLLLAQYLWPHHVREAAFFTRAFVGPVARAGATRFADVGVGTGFYSRLVLTGAAQATGIGFDVSPTACDFARWHVDAFGAVERYEVEVRDIEARPPEPVPWLLSVEVLEHLERPEGFLAALRRMLVPGGTAFIGTALNAPNADHLYLYRTSEEVAAQLRRAGFRVRESFRATARTATHGVRPAPEVAAFLVS